MNSEPGTPNSEPIPPAIAVRDLSKTYHTGLLRREQVQALDEVTLEVAPGEIFGLLGPNGAGKTTLVKVLLSVVHPGGGEARLFGRPAREPAARRAVGYLPENHRFPDFLTAEKMLDVYGRLGGVPPDARRRRIPELLGRVGLAKQQKAKLGTFSKGMRQRAGLAQALLGDPDLLFLDEPTDGVDPVGRRDIRDLLVWLRGQGTTVFINSHLLSEVEQVCSRIAILNEGRLVRHGTLEELMAVERAYDLTATPLPDETLRALDGVLGELPDGAVRPAAGLRRYRILAHDRAHLNAVLDRLRSAGVEIEAVRPLRRTLEEYFIDVVEGKGREGEREKG